MACSRPAGQGRRWTRLVAVMLIAGAAAGCSLFGNKDDFNIPDDPADKLYNEGLFLLQNKKDYKAAAKKFEEVDRQHPYSEWARKALLMSAYSYYEGGNYDETINSAKRYVTLHPGSADSAYAQFLIGSAYYDQIPDISRDQARTEKAMAALDDIVRKYPGTEYAAGAKKKIEMARDNLAGKEMDIGRYYLEKKNFIGAINRFKVVVTRYQTTRHVEEALMRLTEAYMALGIVQEAQTAAAVLGHNFPDSRWYQEAYNLVKGGGLEPAENEGSWMSKAFKKLGVG
jgi:outer membrane protein assembly factor BamD